jgi:hypothetical protein
LGIRTYPRQRPYLTVEAREPSDTSTIARFYFSLVFENRGSVPSAILSWDIWGTLMDLDGQEQAVNQMDAISMPVGWSLASHEVAVIDARSSVRDSRAPSWHSESEATSSIEE